jgi:hypothetical protein
MRSRECRRNEGEARGVGGCGRRVGMGEDLLPFLEHPIVRTVA